MALMQLAVGAELDIATGAELRDESKKLAGLIDKGPPRASHLPLAGSITVSAGSNVIDLGHPPVGRIWEIRFLTLAGADDHTMVNGAAALYIGDPTAPSLSQLRVPGLAIPSYQLFPSGGYWCYPSENLFVSLFSVATGQPVVAVAGVDEWRLSDVGQSQGR